VDDRRHTSNMADRVRFQLTTPEGVLVFGTSAIKHSATRPWRKAVNTIHSPEGPNWFPASAQPRRVYFPLRKNYLLFLARNLTMAESRAHDAQARRLHRFSKPRRRPQRLTLQTWCGRSELNRQTGGFEPTRYSNSLHIRVVGKLGFEPRSDWF
jgi:hypothetical protein